MATTLPGSPYVESSDLVANYPAVSESLAERIDLVGVLPFASAAARTTALPTPTDGQYSYLQDTNSTEYYNGAAWVASGIAPGLVHINTTSFTAVSSVSLNNVFTTDYTNYLIQFNATVSATADTHVRLRASGTDNSTTNYKHSGFYQDWGSVLVGDTGSGIAQWTTGTNADPVTNTLEILSPQLSTKTRAKSDAFGTTRIVRYLMSFEATTAFDGFSLIRTSGTFTGIVRVYGYKNS